MMVNTIDLRKKFYDPMKKFRTAAIAGKLDNGSKKINDPRSRNTTSL